MTHKLKTRLLSMALTAAMVATTPLAMLKAAAEEKAKYISEVFIAYGETEEDAIKWLNDHGWEPVGKDLNAGKLSYWDDNDDDKVAAVMGIHRTALASEAITDMAVMNMNGGYSFKDYKKIVAEKETEINEFVDSFLPVLEEYRDNYNNKGSAAGKARADLAHELLNKFYDGEISDDKDVHDTGKPIGDLLLQQTSRELGDSYDNMSKNERLEHADITQILLESTSAAVQVVEQSLAIATDTSEDTWLDRLSAVSGMDMVSNIDVFVPENNGKKLAPSAAKSLLQSKFGDAAALLAEGYDDVQQDLLWYEAYMENNGLWQGDEESDVDYDARMTAYFDALKANDEIYYNDTLERLIPISNMYNMLYSINYEGDWGETLGDFFNPAEEGTNYGDNPDYFLLFAAVLSKGQRAGLEFLPLYSLLRIGTNTEEGIKQSLPEVDTLVGEDETISIFAGNNRNIFRGGVALTSQAMVQENMGKTEWYDDALDPLGTINVLTYVSMFYGISAIVCAKSLLSRAQGFGGFFFVKLPKDFYNVKAVQYAAEQCFQMELKEIMTDFPDLTYSQALVQYDEMYPGVIKQMTQQEAYVKNSVAKAKMGAAGRWMMTLGAVLLLAAASMQIYQMYKYYQRDFTAIPMMIVDEADIVTYLTDENGNPILDDNGNQKKNITFDQYAYYEVVRCNRQEVGEIGDWQDGVSDYKKWGCGDAADINCDCGLQWLAMYTVKSPQKGNPILADSITYQTGTDAMPDGCTKGLHFFTYTYAADLGDTAYAFNNDKHGIYIFWDEDKNAYLTASTFSTGQMALAGIGGLAVGILGATAAMMLGKKKKDTPDAPAAA